AALSARRGSARRPPARPSRCRRRPAARRAARAPATTRRPGCGRPAPGRQGASIPSARATAPEPALALALAVWIGSPQAVASMGSSLKEKPAVAFQVFGAIPAAWKPVFRLGENAGAGSLRPLIMLVHVIDVDQHAVDDPWDLRPGTGALAMLAMPLRALVVGT